MFDSWFRTTTTTRNENVIITANRTTTTKTVEKSIMQNKLLLLSPESKVLPTVKATSVNVIIDEDSQLTDESQISEPTLIPNQDQPFRSASISLSIELAKKNSTPSINTTKNFMQKPDSVTPQSSLSKNIPLYHPNRPSSIQSSNSLLQRMAHSPKAAAATFPTSVSASGNVTFDYDQEQTTTVDQPEEEQEIKSPAMKSLTKRIQPFKPPQMVTNHNMDELTEDEVMNPALTTTTTPTVSMTNTDDEDEKSVLSDESDHHQQTTSDSHIQDPPLPNVKAEIIAPTLSTCENNSTLHTKGEDQPGNGYGFWSWLGFLSSENVQTQSTSIPPPPQTTTITPPEQQLNTVNTEETIANTEDNIIKTTSEPEILPLKKTPTSVSIPQQIMQSNKSTTTTTTAIATATTVTTYDNNTPSPASSWMSFLFPSKPASIPPPEKKVIEPIAPRLPSSVIGDDSSLRKVKSTSSLPAAKPDVTILRNSTSISSLNNIIPKKNQVLPPFHSQFYFEDVPVTPPPTNNILSKAMDALNAILAPDQQEDTTPNWIAKRMKIKFSNFIDEIKSSSDPIKKAMIDKRIVIVGVHGWFPMKVKKKHIYTHHAIILILSCIARA